MNIIKQYEQTLQYYFDNHIDPSFYKWCDFYVSEVSYMFMIVSKHQNNKHNLPIREVQIVLNEDHIGIALYERSKYGYIYSPIHQSKRYNEIIDYDDPELFEEILASIEYLKSSNSWHDPRDMRNFIKLNHQAVC